MENQQAVVVSAQNQPLNNPPTENANNEESGAEKSRKARITKIKEKLLPGVKITLLLSLVVYIAMLVIGILGVHHCPVEENIPLFLIATGAIGLITKITTYMREHILRHVQVGYIESSLYTVEMVFLILGSFWVYKEYVPSYVESDLRYCWKSAYLFAFVYITIVYVMIALGLLAILVCCLCCTICISACCASCDVEGQEEEDDELKKGREG